MTWTDLWTGIGDFFTWMFQIMKPIGNKYNFIAWVIIGALVFSRAYVISQQTKKAKRDGTLP